MIGGLNAVVGVLQMPKISEKNSFSPSAGGLACSVGKSIAPQPSPGVVPYCLVGVC